MQILLANDGTRYGEAAAAMLSRFALGSGDAIHVVCVLDLALPFGIDLYGGFVPDTGELERTARENARKVVDTTAIKLAEKFPEAVVTTDVIFGSAEGRIVETAEEIGADLIVLGSHGAKQWERILLGSVSNSVVHHAHCSVLVVRTLDEE